MMNSELNELRKRKTKRIILWTCGITAAAAIITIFTIFVLADLQSSSGGWPNSSSLSLLRFYGDLINPVNYILSVIKNINLI